MIAFAPMKHLGTTLVALFFVAACGSKKPEPVAAAAEPAPAAAAPEPAEAPVAEGVEAPAEAEAPAPDPKEELLAAETAAYEAAKPVFEKYCASCHTASGAKKSAKKLAEFDMSGYPFSGKYAADIANTTKVVLGVGSKKKATMPQNKPGSVKGADLDLVVAWADAWQKAQDGGAH